LFFSKTIFFFLKKKNTSAPGILIFLLSKLFIMSPKLMSAVPRSILRRNILRVILTYPLLFFLSLQAKTQTSINAAEEVAKAEMSFAKKAIQTNTKQAFLDYYDDSVVVFRNGKPVNGIVEWNKRKVDSSELWWQPVFADISASGDFGYTTGPWEWKRLKTDNSASAYGYYNSIWKKGKDGTWKVVIDIGIPNPIASVEKNKTTAFSEVQSKGVSKNFEALKNELSDVEKIFLEACKKNNHQAYNTYISKEIRIYRPNHLPYLSPDAVQTALADTSITFSFEFIDGDVASSGDLGYVYGNVKARGIINGQSFVADLSYMRIWKRENTGEWKIVLDVIGGA
jgi:ketosteroid isomerase-like protein